MPSHRHVAASRDTRPPNVPFTDEYGTRCLRVPLDPYGSKYAVVREADYQSVRNAGATGAWYLNDNGHGQRYVRTPVPAGTGRNTLLMVARIIADAPPRSTIFYVNKDRLDLRPTNLHWHPRGVSKRHDMRLAEHGAAYRAEREAERAAAGAAQ